MRLFQNQDLNGVLGKNLIENQEPHQEFHQKSRSPPRTLSKLKNLIKNLIKNQDLGQDPIEILIEILNEEKNLKILLVEGMAAGSEHVCLQVNIGVFVSSIGRLIVGTHSLKKSNNSQFCNSFSNRTIDCWNSLPSELVSSGSVAVLVGRRR